MRTAGSTLGSLAPPLLARPANWRAASQLSGPCPESALARSPNMGRPANGLSLDAGPVRSSSAMRAAYGVAPGHSRRRQVCDTIFETVASSSMSVTGSTATATPVWVSDGTGGLECACCAWLRPATGLGPPSRRSATCWCGSPRPTPTPAPYVARAPWPGSAPRCTTIRTSPTWCWCRRRWCTGRGPTTRCRSRRMRSSAPTWSSRSPASWVRPSNWSTSGAWLCPAGRSRCCGPRLRWHPMAPAASPARSLQPWGSEPVRPTRPLSSCISTISRAR